MNIRPLVFVAVGMLFSLTSCKEEPAAATSSASRPSLGVEGYIVTPSSFEEDFIASGNILPNEAISIIPEISGRITGIFFKEGSRVKKGETLVTLYHDDIVAQINKLKAQKKLLDKTLERQQELLRIGGISHQDFETTETQIAAIEADIAAQEAQLRKTKIIAPFDGVMGIRNVSEGAVVTQGVEISTLQQLDPLKMDFMLPEQYHGKVKPSDTVYFTMTGDTNRYAAVVAAVDPGAGTNTRSFRVRALVPNPGHRMVPGSYASVLVPLKSNNNALLIPSRCVIPTTRDKKVALLRNGKATFVVVKLGMRTNDKVEIIQGIGTGDTLITTGLMQIRAEMPVRITKITS